MPNWAPPARSYATRILANETSALVHMVDTPELFGGELRVLAAIDLVDGKIVRWVDYWDGSAFDAALYAQFRTPADSFPTDLEDGQVATQAAPELVAAATTLQRAFARGGRAGRGCADAHRRGPRGHGAAHPGDRPDRDRPATWGGSSTTCPTADRARCVTSSAARAGGGFEWTAASGALVGITAIELDADGLVTTVTSVYDSRQLARPVKLRSSPRARRLRRSIKGRHHDHAQATPTTYRRRSRPSCRRSPCRPRRSPRTRG